MMRAGRKNNWQKRSMRILKKKPFYPLTIVDVRLWEENKKIPLSSLVETINAVLIEALNLQGQEAENFALKMKEAALLSRELIAAGQTLSGSNRYGDLLHEALQRADISEKIFLEALKKKLPQSKYDFDDVYCIEHGIKEPDSEFKEAAKIVLTEGP